MRIRRRPQPFSFLPSDPSTSSALQTPSSAARNQECPVGDKKEGRLHPNMDLGDKSGVVKHAALPQDNVVDCSKSLGASEGPADSHRRAYVNAPIQRAYVNAPTLCICSVENGNHSPDQKNSMPCASIAKAEELVNDGTAVTVAAKDEKSGGNGNGGGIKKRRGPAVLMEGSRCSRVNGRGWRCSQPTLVGYSLCEHHLGKGRMRSVANARSGAAQLGRTEPRRLATAAVGAVTAAPKDEEPSLQPC